MKAFGLLSESDLFRKGVNRECGRIDLHIGGGRCQGAYEKLDSGTILLYVKTTGGYMRIEGSMTKKDFESTILDLR